MTELTSTQIAQLTAILTGGGYKRSATKEAASNRFLGMATKTGIINASEILALDFDAAVAAVNAAVRPDPVDVAAIRAENPEEFADIPPSFKIAEAVRATEVHSRSRRAALAVAEEAAPVAPKVRKAREPKADAPDFRQAGKVEATMLDIIKAIGPAKVGAFRAEWIKRDPTGYGRLAPTQQKGIMRKAVNKLVSAGSVAREGSIFQVAK